MTMCGVAVTQMAPSSCLYLVNPSPSDSWTRTSGSWTFLDRRLWRNDYSTYSSRHSDVIVGLVDSCSFPHSRRIVNCKWNLSRVWLFINLPYQQQNVSSKKRRKLVNTQLVYLFKVRGKIAYALYIVIMSIGKVWTDMAEFVSTKSEREECSVTNTHCTLGTAETNAIVSNSII